MVKTFVLIFGLLAVTTPQPGTSGTIFEQHITLYAAKNCKGSTLSAEGPNRHMSSSIFSYYSARVNGIGLFYNNQNFNTGSSVIHFPKKMQNVSDYHHDCYELTVLDGEGKMGSLRFAGDLVDYRRDSLNLYKEETFQDVVQLLVTDAPKGIKPSKSLIITGRSGWTLYEKPEFTGLNLCISPDDPEKFARFVPNISEHINFTSIQSVRKGCDNN